MWVEIEGVITGGSPNLNGDEIADISYRTDGLNGYVMVAKGGARYAYNTPWLGNPTGFSGTF
jgi:hypothetical protein